MSTLDSLVENDEGLAAFLKHGIVELAILDKENNPNIPENSSDFEKVVRVINAELEAMHIPEMLKCPGSNVPQEAAFIHAVDTVSAVVKQHKVLRHANADLATRVKSSQAENQRLALLVRKLESAVDEHKKLALDTNSKLMAVERAADRETLSAQREIAELRAKLQKVQLREKQHMNEIRKRDRELERTKGRLQALIHDKKSATAPSVRMHGVYDPNRFALVQTPSQVPEQHRMATENFCQLVRDSYEKRHVEVLSENEELRQTVRAVQAEMRDLLASNQKETPGRSAGGDDDDRKMEELAASFCLTPNTPRMELLPIQFVRQDVKESLARKMEQIRARKQELDEASNSPEVQSHGDAADVVIDGYRNLAKEQDELLQLTASKLHVSSSMRYSTVTRPQFSPHPKTPVCRVSAAPRSAVVTGMSESEHLPEGEPNTSSIPVRAQATRSQQPVIMEDTSSADAADENGVTRYMHNSFASRVEDTAVTRTQKVQPGLTRLPSQTGPEPHDASQGQQQRRLSYGSSAASIYTQQRHTAAELETPASLRGYETGDTRSADTDFLAESPYPVSAKWLNG
ncbi:hypothetical protein FVE85_5806 [Porphyridium purpureum]|uniref:Afadin-and alpha-actinin-binding protein n=1 Tax=Porphyridium purpureum TaxID=35688 RepID=A0A5J4Z2X4_PORPP|nr:hypothetical protein FVE85_5806 [Porphyridium purpureum]|eukprot:POR1055..scf295_1